LGLYRDIQRHVASIGVDAGTPMGWTVAELTEARRNAERPQEERNTLGDRSRVIWRESRVSDPARRSALLNDPEALASRSKLRRAKESTSHLGNAADEVDVNRVNATLNEPESETLAPLASVPAQDDGVAGGIRQSVTVGDLVNMPGEAPRQIDDAYRENVAQSQHLDTVKEPSLAQRSHPILEAPDGTEQIDEKSPPLPPQALAALANDALGVSAPSSQLAELAHLAHSAQSSYLRHCATCSCATTSESACPGVQELKS